MCIPRVNYDGALMKVRISPFHMAIKRSYTCRERNPCKISQMNEGSSIQPRILQINRIRESLFPFLVMYKYACHR